MKFFLALLCAILASVATGAPIEVDLGGRGSASIDLLAQQIAPLLLQRSPMLNYRSVTLNQAAAGLQGVASAPQIYAIAAPVRQQVQQVQQAVQAFQVVPVQIAHQQQQQRSSAPIQAAVQSRRNVQFIDVPSNGGAGPRQTIVIGPSVQPLDFEFISQSSPISVRQSHIPGVPNPPQESSHTDEPDVLRQTITKPIIHNVQETIQPIRRISQQVNPNITQTFAKEQQKQQQQQAAVVAVAQPIAVAAVAAQPETIAVEAIQEQPIIAIAEAAPTAALNSAVLESAPQTLLLVEGGVSGGITGSLQTRTVPVNAKITRF